MKPRNLTDAGWLAFLVATGNEHLASSRFRGHFGSWGEKIMAKFDPEAVPEHEWPAPLGKAAYHGLVGSSCGQSSRTQRATQRPS